MDCGKTSSITKVRFVARLWAALLSLVLPGFGQAFCGAYRRAVWFAFADVLLLLIAMQSAYLWPWLPAGTLIAVVWFLATASAVILPWWGAIDAFRFRDYDLARFERHRARYLVYAGFVALFAGRQLMVVVTHWEPFSIPSTSMEPTALPGDYVLTINGYYRGHQPQRGELVIFALPSDPSVTFFKRIIGLPGDRIQMQDGILYINDAPVQRKAVGPYIFTGEKRPQIFHEYREAMENGASYLIAVEGDDQPLENTQVFTVPPGRYFMLGDNRDNSADSRDPDSGVGFVPLQNLKAYPAFICFSTAGTARWWEIWKWSQSIRWDRIGQRLN
jgi:signal peptidase I